MGDKVVPLHHKIANDDSESGAVRHIAVPAVCLACRHKWSAVAPAGTVALECPACGTNRGVSAEHVLPGDGAIWQCGCGCHAFSYSAKYRGWLCLSCGREQVFP